ncbi:SgcJ/EcaC family oxidoreductase [Methylobacterium sp. J-030]|uniref:YybH family protein n=1 Tax=Methylobacterium sp. J-030 TaxID=2836627 RepID=UPI001FBB818C|nr:SgcJ/EcaC family oxidoreductase [Methylobacterium sp. J-030]MCJ2074026.1 SgcJ/EcaC family oxidoreductase [Methylobacterium sp. J-030]
MRVRLVTMLALGLLGGLMGGPVLAQSTGGAAPTRHAAADEEALRAVLASYNAALNGGQTAAVLPLYTPDGIFMAPYSPSFIGQTAIRKAYDAVFAELKFDVRFDIAEVVQIAPAWAFVRTNSAGTTLHHSTGKTTAEANQELFIFRKGDDGSWRIARYSFSPTNPPGL